MNDLQAVTIGGVTVEDDEDGWLSISSSESPSSLLSLEYDDIHALLRCLRLMGFDMGEDSENKADEEFISHARAMAEIVVERGYFGRVRYDALAILDALGGERK